MEPCSTMLYMRSNRLACLSYRIPFYQRTASVLHQCSSADAHNDQWRRRCWNERGCRLSQEAYQRAGQQCDSSKKLLRWKSGSFTTIKLYGNLQVEDPDGPRMVALRASHLHDLQVLNGTLRWVRVWNFSWKEYYLHPQGDGPQVPQLWW